jgi:alpha-L-rhamnosidase
LQGFPDQISLAYNVLQKQEGTWEDLLAKARKWSAQMIAPLSDRGQGTAASFVGRTFDLTAVPSEATLHISAQGLYRCFINGQRVGDDVLTPGWTNYDDRIAYQSYPIAGLLRTGSNRIDIWLADGWYRSQLLWKQNPIFNCYGDRIAAIAEIVADNKVLLFSDEKWGCGTLPITQSGIYFGEDYDARLDELREIAGVEAVDFDTKLLVPHETGAVKEIAPFQAIETWSDEGRTVYDFGQNAGGYVRFTVQGDAGATVHVEHSEVLGPNRHFDNRNYRSARAQIIYTLKGGAPETYAPVFTFMGFRYARVTIRGDAQLKSIALVPITSIPLQAGGFECGDKAINRLVLNTLWSQRSNFIEVPTDCPQRDERLGWTGDANVFAGTACWLGDTQSFFRKYLRDVMVDQRKNGAIPHFSPDPTRLHPMGDSSNPAKLARAGDWAGSTGWGDAIVTIPWQVYLHYGDTAVLKECFPAMLKWLSFVWNISNGPVVRPPSRWGAKGFTFGDWIQPIGDNRKPRPTISDECAATLYHGISTQLAAKIAAILGNNKDAVRLRKRFAEIQKAFAHEFFSPAGRLAHNDQTSYALAFLYDMVPAKYHEKAKGYFRQIIVDADYKIGTGFIGTPALLPALTKIGLVDVAEKLLLNRQVPGWLYQVECGATSIWERWDAQGPHGEIYDPDMNSYNHYAYGAVCQWLFENVAGVSPSAANPGFDEIIISPNFLPALSPVKAWHDCRHGRMEAGWSVKGDTARYSLKVPEHVTARIVPAEGTQLVSVDGKKGAKAQRLSAGKHELVFKIQMNRRKSK